MPSSQFKSAVLLSFFMSVACAQPAQQLKDAELPPLPRDTHSFARPELLAAPLFLFAIGNAFAGVLIIYRILWPRASRFLEHSTNFTPAAARAR